MSKSLECRVRRLAQRHGYRVSKSHRRTRDANNHGFYRLVNDRNEAVLGDHYDAKLHTILDYLKDFSVEGASRVMFGCKLNDGRDWADVGAHELDQIKRDGILADVISRLLRGEELPPDLQKVAEAEQSATQQLSAIVAAAKRSRRE